MNKELLDKKLPGRQRESKMNVAKVRGRSASPRVLKVPSLNSSAFSRKTATSAGPRGIFFNRFKISDSW
jgi:hypothetical protein